MRYLVLFVIFIFSPLAFNANGNFGKTEIAKKELVKDKPVSPKTLEEELIEAFSSWNIAEASYYDPKDTSQTKDNCDGLGTFERMIGSGSIALGSSFTDQIRDKNIEIFIEVENLNVITPYGKGIFRIDDVMPGDYGKEDIVHVDFFQDDLSSELRTQGVFKIKFRIVKILNRIKNTTASL